MSARERGKRKTKIGVVISEGMDKTVVVEVDRVYVHPRYKKVVRDRTRCYVHDGENSAREGDLVRIIECRPLSKLKRWRLVEVVRRGAPQEGARFAEQEVEELQARIQSKPLKEEGAVGEKETSSEAPPQTDKIDNSL